MSQTILHLLTTSTILLQHKDGTCNPVPLGYTPETAPKSITEQCLVTEQNRAREYAWNSLLVLWRVGRVGPDKGQNQLHSKLLLFFL